MTLKMKLISTVTMICLVVGVLIMGVLAAVQQTITLQGSVNFEISDKSLYIKDVRMQVDNNSEPQSLKASGKFMPGYINSNFNMNLGTFTNSYGSFALYFDIINTSSLKYTVDASTTQSGVTVSAIVDNESNQIPAGTVTAGQITPDTEISASIKLTVTAPTGAIVELNKITATINEVEAIDYENYTFTINETDKTAVIDKYSGTEENVIIPSTFSIRESDGAYIEGNDYTVTAISGSRWASGFPLNTTSVELPKTLIYIEASAFRMCSNLQNITIPESVTIIDRLAFYGCARLTNVIFEEGSQLNSISDYAFQDCNNLTTVDLSGCTNLTNIGVGAFYNCSSLTSVKLGALTPPTISSDTFGDVNSSFKIYVPSSSLSAYSSDSTWSSLGYQIIGY